MSGLRTLAKASKQSLWLFVKFESTGDQSIRTNEQDSGQQLSAFLLTANVNDLAKASEGPRGHPQNGGGGRK